MDTCTISSELTEEAQRVNGTICLTMGSELDRQLRNHYPLIEVSFKDPSERLMILEIFAGRFFNYISREKILIREGQALGINAWYALSKEFAHDEHGRSATYLASEIMGKLLSFLQERGYRLALPPESSK